MPGSKVKVAAIQAAPVFLNLEASLQKALALIEEAATNGARLLVFPEAFLPAWPAWVDEVLPGNDEAWHVRLLDQSVVVPGSVTERLGAAARDAGVHLVMGVDEREEHGGTIYNAILYFDVDGQLLGKHRKLMPTHAERLVWGIGDGSDLRVHQTGVGRVGGLICWENYMPLARFAIYAQGVDIWVAPTLANPRALGGQHAPHRPRGRLPRDHGGPGRGSPTCPTACPSESASGGGSSRTATGCWTATR